MWFVLFHLVLASVEGTSDIYQLPCERFCRVCVEEGNNYLDLPLKHLFSSLINITSLYLVLSFIHIRYVCVKILSLPGHGYRLTTYTMVVKESHRLTGETKDTRDGNDPPPEGIPGTPHQSVRTELMRGPQESQASPVVLCTALTTLDMTY